jgi:hypothetical protein
LVFDIEEECRVWVLENRELRRIFALMGGEMIGCWRKFSLPNIIRIVKLRIR